MKFYCVRRSSFVAVTCAFAVMATGSSSTPAFSAKQLAEIVAAVKGSMHDKIQSLKRELVQDKEATEETLSLVKRARLEKVPVFRKKSHEKQFDFNTSVMETVPSCSAMDKAKSLIAEDTKLVKFRQN